MADMDFFFDFISPYTYLARTQLDGIAAASARGSGCGQCTFSI